MQCSRKMFLMKFLGLDSTKLRSIATQRRLSKDLYGHQSIPTESTRTGQYQGTMTTKELSNVTKLETNYTKYLYFLFLCCSPPSPKLTELNQYLRARRCSAIYGKSRAPAAAHTMRGGGWGFEIHMNLEF